MRKAVRGHLREAETDTEGTWAISYGDMITLLLTFFILFFSVEPPQPPEERMESLKLSLLDVLDARKNMANPGGGGGDKTISTGEGVEAGVSEGFIKKFNGIAYKFGKKIIIDFPGISFFDSASTVVTQEGTATLKDFVTLYMPYAGNFILNVRAFADPRPVIPHAGRKFSDNLELTALRSVSAMRILQKAGVPLSRVKVAGYGETQLREDEYASLPESMRQPASIMDLARRVVLVIEPEEIAYEKHQ